jgi:hypothetical protein
MITLQSPGSPTGKNFSGITGWRLDQWKRTQRLQLSMSIPPTKNVKTVSNLIMEFPIQLLHLARIQERGTGKREDAEAAESHALWAISETVDVVTMFSEGLNTRQYNERRHYQSVRVSLTKWLLGRIRDKEGLVKETEIEEEAPLQFRVVEIIDGLLCCSCKYYQRVGLPCRYLLHVTQDLKPGYCELRWWRGLSFMQGRTICL